MWATRLAAQCLVFVLSNVRMCVQNLIMDKYSIIENLSNILIRESEVKLSRFSWFSFTNQPGMKALENNFKPNESS